MPSSFGRFWGAKNQPSTPIKAWRRSGRSAPLAVDPIESLPRHELPLEAVGRSTRVRPGAGSGRKRTSGAAVLRGVRSRTGLAGAPSGWGNFTAQGGTDRPRLGGLSWDGTFSASSSAVQFGQDRSVGGAEFRRLLPRVGSPPPHRHESTRFCAGCSPTVVVRP